MTDIARLAEEISAHGVRRLFGVPGSGVTLSLIDALEKRGIAFHLTHFEGAGALMAATVGRPVRPRRASRCRSKVPAWPMPCPASLPPGSRLIRWCI